MCDLVSLTSKCVSDAYDPAQVQDKALCCSHAMLSAILSVVMSSIVVSGQSDEYETTETTSETLKHRMRTAQRLVLALSRS